jgi:uncharacterized protein
MKLHLSDAPGKNLFTGYGEGYVLINGKRHEGNLIVLPGRTEPWKPRGVDDLTAEDFARLAALGVEIVLLGTGKRQRFPSPALSIALPAAGIGLEVMDTGAACRTYNILVAEGREVAAALVLETDS